MMASTTQGMRAERVEQTSPPGLLCLARWRRAAGHFRNEALEKLIDENLCRPIKHAPADSGRFAAYLGAVFVFDQGSGALRRQAHTGASDCDSERAFQATG